MKIRLLLVIGLSLTCILSRIYLLFSISVSLPSVTYLNSIGPSLYMSSDTTYVDLDVR